MDTLQPLTEQDRAAIRAIGQSHTNTAAAIRRIAELKIAAFDLKCTPEEYIAECERRQNENTRSL